MSERLAAIARLSGSVRGEAPNATVRVLAGDLGRLLAEAGVDPGLRPIDETRRPIAMDDATLIALCVFTEARGEPYEGKVAVSRVIHNRVAERYFSDGTAEGTVLAYDQFSGFWFDFVDGRYARVCSTLDQARARADLLLQSAQSRGSWDDCVRAVADGQRGSAFAWGPQGRRVDAEPRTLLYCDLAISHPAWANPAQRVAAIFNHTFFRA